MKTKDKLLIYVGIQTVNDGLSLILCTKNDGIFVSNFNTINKSSITNIMNVMQVDGDKNYISRYLADWLISVSGVVIKSSLVRMGSDYDIVNVVKRREIQFVSDKRIDVTTLNKLMTGLLLFNGDTRIITLSGSGKYIIEDTTGMAVVNNKILSIDYVRNKNLKNQ